MDAGKGLLELCNQEVKAQENEGTGADSMLGSDSSHKETGENVTRKAKKNLEGAAVSDLQERKRCLAIRARLLPR
jgi:hypothetical protein